MKRLLVLAVLLIAALHPQSTTAQTANKCDLSPLFTSVSAIKSRGNSAADMTTLLKLADTIHTTNTDCYGYRFKGTGKKIVGPVELKGGVNQVILSAAYH